MNEWSRSTGGMTRRGENANTRNKTFPSATFPTTNPQAKWIGIKPEAPQWKAGLLTA